VDGATVYLSKDSLNTEVFTSKCSSVNINVPSEEDYVENPLPEQMRSYIQNGKVVSEIVEHAG
jgi:adenylyl cyclase-associated protein